ncbi:hypothetical protein ACHAXT_007858 [Thalassiosira profunda]
MNATRSVLLRPRALPVGQCRRPLHVVSASMEPISSMKSSPAPHKQSQNRFVAVAIEEQIPQPSARDILRLLSNIGAEHRASLPKIESLMQQNARNGRSTGGDLTPVTSHEVIDLISKIRSM